MTSGELIALCEPLGWGWQTMLASHLRLSDRTIRRKASGESRITKSEAAAIRRFARRKQKEQPR